MIPAKRRRKPIREMQIPGTRCGPTFLFTPMAAATTTAAPPSGAVQWPSLVGRW